VLSCAAVSEVVVVAPATHLDAARDIAADSEQSLRSQQSVRHVPVCRQPAGPVTVVAGGAERGDSVAAGLAILGATVDVVLVHDAARCLTPVAVFERVITAVERGAVAVVPGTTVVDTIKQVDEHGRVVGTPDRSRLRAVQTPQGFRRDVLARAHAAYGGATDATDDAGLVERLGEPVLVVDGDVRALKVTTPEDLDTAARLLTAP
jgi:2-C-methyl-D-erythritol 4-phosphate cytidylyltransferase